MSRCLRRCPTSCRSRRTRRRLRFSEPNLPRGSPRGHTPWLEQHCPHCGTGALFIGWVWIVTDRIPIGIGIVLLYFGFRVRSFWMGVLFFGSMSLPLLLTIPRRYGLAIAITYLIRKRWPDPKDNFPVSSY